MKDVTIVSALFNIERENMDGRKWDEYLEWFDITLKLQCPMYLFITEDVREFVEERRTTIPTEIIVKTEDDLPYYHLNDEIQEILDNPDYRKKMSDPNRIECKHSMYSVIQYSKFPWLVEAAKENPFNSNYFFWLDAGGSRFFDGYGLDGQYPGNNAMESLNSMGESFLVQENCDYYPDLFDADQLPSSYLYDNRSFVLGSMFGGHKNSLEETAKMVDDVLMNKMIGENSINNEQIALGYLLKNNPDHFAAYQRTNGKHMDIFRELSQ
tara:strand:- start:6097 stop:6900 length:804 start_codon:yes stop_codon:yes gene_type:complete